MCLRMLMGGVISTTGVGRREGWQVTLPYLRGSGRSEQEEARQRRRVRAQACGGNCLLRTFPGSGPQPCGQRFPY